ncbi:metal-dependent phosphohydrolase HD sub domain protein [Candidatus Magnetoovum chiemensis]|nr:metal-dependent phosphohydrolase HD sub domain protein [Candidatus Magnetoovum chiemensis]
MRRIGMSKIAYYYDPIYDQIVIPDATSTSAVGRSRDMLSTSAGQLPPDELTLNEVIRKVISSDEFDRLSFLYQSGIAWLVFPSSTHTRFAHSLGCYHLGTIALKSIKIEDGQSKQSLEEWLTTDPSNSRNKRASLKGLFLIALLCHDIGHFPFSHTIESNFEINIKKTHEERVKDILQTGFFENFKDLYRGCIYCDNGGEEELLKSSLLYLISDEERDKLLKLLKSSHKEAYIKRIDVLKKLVSGLLDLDRVDHYLRDSFFTGVKLVNFNIAYLLKGMTFRFKDDASTFDMVLERDALIHAKNLLYSKEQIGDAIFENPNVISFELILNKCITEYYIKKERTDLDKIYDMRDWELLTAIKSSLTDKSKLMFDRIMKKESLYFVGKFILNGKYDTISLDNGNIECKFEEDSNHLKAVEKFYTFVLKFNVLGENINLSSIDNENQAYAAINRIYNKHENEIKAIIKEEFEKSPSEALDDDKIKEYFIKCLLFHSKCADAEGKTVNILRDITSESFIKMRNAIYSKITREEKRALFNAIKKQFLDNLRRTLSNQGIHIKFSKKFLDFYEQSGDIKDLSKTVLRENGEQITKDANEKEFLRMLAARDVKSRINLWVFTENKIEDEPKKNIIEELQKCGFIAVRG